MHLTIVLIAARPAGPAPGLGWEHYAARDCELKADSRYCSACPVGRCFIYPFGYQANLGIGVTASNSKKTSPRGRGRRQWARARLHEALAQDHSRPGHGPWQQDARARSYVAT